MNCICYSLLHNKILPHLADSTKNLYHLIVSEGQKSNLSLSGWFHLQVAHEITVELHPGLQ